MKLEVNGKQYTDFVSANCQIRLDTLSNSFNFEAVMTDGQALPFKVGNSCKIIVDDEPVLTGFIEVISVDYDGEDHTINIGGRDKTGDFLDSSIGFMSDIRGAELSLKVIIENVIAHLGQNIKVIDEVEPILFSGAEDIAAPEPGDNAFDFVSKYAEKRQVLLTSNGDSDIVIAANSGIKVDGAVQHIIGATDNNVIASTFSFDTTGRYNLYQLSSSLNPTALNQAGDTDLASVVNQSGGVFDTLVRQGRVLTIKSTAPLSNRECTNRAFWEANIRKARGLIYSATVREFRVGGSEGDLWAINRVYQIVDDFIGKTELMLCNSVTFSMDADEGRITELGFVGQTAYTLDIEDDPLAEVADNVG